MKKVMIALLALAVLFSFAACDNSNGGSGSVGAVARIYSTNIPQYLTGEKIDLADFDLVGEDVNGNEVAINVEDIVVVDSAALVADADTTSDSTFEAGRGVIKSALSYKGADIVSLYYDAFEADANSLKVAGPAENEEYYVDSAKKNLSFNYSKYTVSVTYTVNGEKVTKTLDAAAGDYTVDFDTVAVAANKGTPQAITFTTAVGGSAQTDSTSVKIDVIDDPVVGIVAELVDEDTPIYSGASASAVKSGDYTSVINVYQKLTSGYVEDTAITKSSALVFAAQTGLVTGESGSEVYGAAGTYKVDITYTPSGTDLKTSQNIVITADKITKIAASVADSNVLNTSTGTGVAVGDKIPKAEITVTPTWASGKTATVLDPEDYTVDPDTVPTTATPGSTIDVKVSLVNSTEVSPVSVTIKVAAAK